MKIWTHKNKLFSSTMVTPLHHVPFKLWSSVNREFSLVPDFLLSISIFCPSLPGSLDLCSVYISKVSLYLLELPIDLRNRYFKDKEKRGTEDYWSALSLWGLTKVCQKTNRARSRIVQPIMCMKWFVLHPNLPLKMLFFVWVYRGIDA